jgi:hypothetical protein
MTATPKPRQVGDGFVDATEKVDALLARPDIAAFIEAQRPARQAMNAAFAVNLAKVREAAGLTQKRIAEAMGRDVSGVSKMEGRGDNILLSTLAEYLAAAGVQAAAITVTVNGLDYSFDLTAAQSGERDRQDA